MQPTDGATASANPSWIMADMGALIHQCDAKLAEHDAQLDRLMSGIAALESQWEAVRSEREQVVVTRERAVHVQEALLAAAHAGAALRNGHLDADASFKVAPDSDERDDTVSGTDKSAGPTETAAAGPAEESGHQAPADAPTAADASKLGPRGMQVLQIINSVPGHQWTPKLLAVHLEGQEAEADEKAHNRARALLDDLAKKAFLVKKHRDNSRRCYFVAATATEAA
ncbi:hypothetical protein AB5L52_25620 [Streptomyces sp. CG4]|uniref:hypothetical protein n=1 Tax=Streptomyces sp. CG4 TaxID=408783 RepID=UPI0034E2CE50